MLVPSCQARLRLRNTSSCPGRLTAVHPASAPRVGRASAAGHRSGVLCSLCAARLDVRCALLAAKDAALSSDFEKIARGAGPGEAAPGGAEHRLGGQAGGAGLLLARAEGHLRALHAGGAATLLAFNSPCSCGDAPRQGRPCTSRNGLRGGSLRRTLPLHHYLNSETLRLVV